MQLAELRHRAARTIRDFLAIEGREDGGAAFLCGYVAAARDVGAITPRECALAHDALRNRELPAGRQWWWPLADNPAWSGSFAQDRAH